MARTPAVRSHLGTLIGGLIVGIATVGAGVARGDVMYNVTNLGSLSPVGLDNQGRAYLNQSTEQSYHIPNPPYRDRIGYTTTQTARRYEPSGPNAGTFTDLGSNLPVDTSQAGPNAGPVSTRVVSVDPSGRALVAASQGSYGSQGTYLTDGQSATQVGLDHFDPRTSATPVGSGGGVTVLNHGYSTSDPNGYRQEILTAQNGNVSTLTLPGGQQGVAAAVGAAGQIVGQAFAYVPGIYNQTQSTAHAFLAQDGKVTDLGTLGGVWSRPTAVNGSNQVVGASETGATVAVPGYDNYNVPATHAFLWQNGQMKDLGTVANDPHSIALGLNAKGQVVGMSGPIPATSDPNMFSAIGTLGPAVMSGHAFVYDGQKMLDLNTLVEPKPGMNLNAALAINDLGQILATGYYGTAVPSTFLLTPVEQVMPLQPPVLIPEPGSLAVFGLLLGATALHRCRRGRMSPAASHAHA